MMDWFPAVMTLVGLLVGMGVQELRFSRERRDKYKDMVFEKRLDAHQEGYYRITKVLGAMLPHEMMKEGGSEAALKRIEEVEEWRDKNALYLTEDTREKIGDLLECVLDTGREYANDEERKNMSIEEETLKLLRNVGIAQASIVKGVGVKYLPKNAMLRVRIREGESLDEGLRKMMELMKKQMK